MRIALAQINPTVGDLVGNISKIRIFIKDAKKRGADLVIFPEGSVTGYPPLDLLYERDFVRQNKELVLKLASEIEGITAIIGFVDYNDNWDLHNSAAVIQDHHIVKVFNKTLLPTYDVFDEQRYFKPERKENIRPILITIGKESINLGVEICEDLWDTKYDIKVTELLREHGADLVVNISASPYYVNKLSERVKLLREKSTKNKIPMIYVNLVGGQDELVFDGESLAVDKNGAIIAYCKQFEEDLCIFNLNVKTGVGKTVSIPPFEREKEMYNALVLGVRDYFRKTGFHKAVLGLSGGIDSSLVACIAADALGKENVIGISLPSHYSSEHSKEDAEILAKNLGICFLRIPIEKIMKAYQETLRAPLEHLRNYFGVKQEDDDSVADENIQPRIRGNILMDISNRLKKLKILVLNTGNKTELALGYCTLYGDLTGGLGVIGDVSKLDVYKLARYVNNKAGKEIIPERVFLKKPSAELRPNQYDPFDFSIVSPLVEEIVEERKSRTELINEGYPPEQVDDVLRRIRRAEYKRWQAPPCIKITKKAFGIGWKMPIVNKFF